VQGFEAMVANEMLGLSFEGTPFATGMQVLHHIGVSPDAVSTGVNRQVLLIAINYGLTYAALASGQPRYVDLALASEGED
jgi:hypothetical protein